MTWFNKNIVITEATSELRARNGASHGQYPTIGGISDVMKKHLYRIRDLMTIANYRQNYFYIPT